MTKMFITNDMYSSFISYAVAELITIISVYVCLLAAHLLDNIYICHGGEYEYCGNRCISISYGIFMFLWENTFITPL